jgi:hypothetical protein
MGDTREGAAMAEVSVSGALGHEAADAVGTATEAQAAMSNLDPAANDPRVTVAVPGRAGFAGGSPALTAPTCDATAVPSDDCRPTMGFGHTSTRRGAHHERLLARCLCALS